MWNEGGGGGGGGGGVGVGFSIGNDTTTMYSTPTALQF